MKSVMELEAIAGPSPFRKNKKVASKESLSATERAERQLQLEREQKERLIKQKQKDFIDSVVAQSRSFKDHHRNHQLKVVS